MRSPLLAGLIALGACTSGPADPVAALLAELEAAAEARDAERFAGRLAPGFRGDHGLGRAEAVAQLRRWLAAYERVALEVYGVEVAPNGADAARVTCLVEFSGRTLQAFGLQGLLPPSAVYRFELSMSRDNDDWRVDAASWQAVDDDRVLP